MFPRTFDEYQMETARTGRGYDDRLSIDMHRMVLGLGLTGEAGEVADIIKKEVGHDHPHDLQKIVLELGDVMWYVSEMARVHGVPLSRIVAENVTKLRARYPDGFDPERSLHRDYDPTKLIGKTATVTLDDE